MKETMFNPELAKILRASASRHEKDAQPYMAQIAKAFTKVLRQGVLPGNTLDNIYTTVSVDPSNNVSSVEYPLDLYAPGMEGEYAAYTIPNVGSLPYATVESDFVMIPMYDVGNSINWGLKYAQNAQWDVVSRAKEVFTAGFTKKANDDGWHVLLAAAFDRDIMVFDSDANAGQFTKRVLSLAKVIMRRNGGGNSSSANRGGLTDLYLSPESMEDIRNWNVDQLDDITRNEIFHASDDAINSIFNVKLHVLDELGEDQEYQNYFTNTLGGTLTSGDVELMVGFDLRNRDSFVRLSKGGIEVFEDMTLHRNRQAGIYGWESLGWGVMDNRRISLLSS